MHKCAFMIWSKCLETWALPNRFLLIKCHPASNVFNQVEWITHWCSWDCPQPATSFRRTLSFLRSVRVTCRSSKTVAGDGVRRVRSPSSWHVDIPQLDAQQVTMILCFFGQLKLQWAHLNKWSPSGNSSSPSDDLPQILSAEVIAFLEPKG